LEVCRLEIVRHRVNCIEELRAVDPRFGLEFDVRSRSRRLTLAHDAFSRGEPLEPFLRAVARSGPNRLLVFNPKEDGLETEILALAGRLGLKRFFLLDLTLPTLVRLAVRENVRELAVRVSEFEPPEGALRFRGLVRWVWVDCFDGDPPAESLLHILRRFFKVCLVSPELQGYPVERISAFRPLAGAVDAVCTKHPELWRP